MRFPSGLVNKSFGVRKGVSHIEKPRKEELRVSPSGQILKVSHLIPFLIIIMGLFIEGNLNFNNIEGFKVKVVSYNRTFEDPLNRKSVFIWN